jgi:hypothetical protein
MLFRSRRRHNQGGAAVAEPPPPVEDVEAALAEIDQLAAENRERRDPERERRLVTLRHRAGVALVNRDAGELSYPEPATGQLPERNGSGLPEFRPEQVTPELLRAAILRDGCLLVRGVIDREQALGLAGKIDRTFAERDACVDGDGEAGDLYSEFEPDPPYTVAERPWIKEGGGVLAADSPEMFFDMLETFEHAGLLEVVGGYLGERPLISANKCTLRKATPDVPGAWHQDGAFMGDVRAMNIWLSLSRCGDESPGLDLVPRRLDDLVQTGTEGTVLDYQVSQAMAEEAAGEHGIIRPIFEPGDVLLFDDLFLHQTGSDPSMPKPRYAVESWFFGSTGFTHNYVPLVA